MAANEHTEREKAEAAARKRFFLAALRGEPGAGGTPLSVRAACDRLGISRACVRNWRAEDADFAEAYADAMDDGTDLLEESAVKRAVKGVEHDVYGKGGVVVGQKTVYSDDLLKFMLAARAPSRFRAGQEVNVAVNTINAVTDNQAIARALALLLAEAQAKQAKLADG